MNVTLSDAVKDTRTWWPAQIAGCLGRGPPGAEPARRTADDTVHAERRRHAERRLPREREAAPMPSIGLRQSPETKNRHWPSDEMPARQSR
jgi:hypothetical protein